MKVVAGGPPDEIWYLSVQGFLTRRTFCRFLSKLPNVEIIRGPIPFSYFREHEFLEFKFLGETLFAELEGISFDYIEIRSKPPKHNPTLFLLMNELEKAAGNSSN